MGVKISQTIRSGVNANIAFSIVVLASYFATFSGIRKTSWVDILIMVLLGIAYVTFGIYGYAYCSKSPLLMVKVIYLVVQISLGSLIVSLGKGAGFNALILLPLASHAVVLLPELWAYIANLGIIATYLIAVRSFSATWGEVWSGLPPFLAGLMFIIVFTQVAVGEETAREEVERLLVDLEKANQRLREYSFQAEELAIVKERNRMAREIHDGLGHSLTTINMQVQAAQAVMDARPERAKEMLQKANGMAVEALGDVRKSVSALRLPVLNQPLEQAVAHLVESCGHMGIMTELNLVQPVRVLPAPIALAIYRSAQEAINNIQKHSKASKMWLKMDYSAPNQISLEVGDNGVGAILEESGFGLLGIQERARLIGGTCQLITEPGKGFILKVVLPYE